MSAADLITAPRRRSARRRSTLSRVVIYGLQSFFALVYLAPLVIMVMTSLKPIFIVTVIFQFTNIWNDFLFGATYAAGDSSPMTVALKNIVKSWTGVVEYNVKMAAAIIAAAPTLIVYVVAGRYFVPGPMARRVKG